MQKKKKKKARNPVRVFLKKVGFENGIRALAPDIIVTDELNEQEDIDAVKYAINSGISIIATTHADSLETFKRKDSFKELLNEKAFKRFVVLSNKDGPGTFEGVYNENFSRVQLYY